MRRSRRMIFPLLQLLSLVGFSCAEFGTHFSAPGAATSLNLYQPTVANTWTAYHHQRNTYAPPSPSHYPSTYLPQKQLQSPLAPLSTASGLQLYPPPTQSKSQQQPLRYNLAGPDSLFYSAWDQSYYKVTKVNLGATKANPGKVGYGPPPPPYYTSTPAPVIQHPPPTHPPTSPPYTHPPTTYPPTPPPYAHHPHYTQQPHYNINFSVIQTGPAEACPGGGAEGKNPALTPFSYSVYPAPAGCPPEILGGSPHFGVLVPVNPDTSVYSSPSSSSSSFSSSESEFSGGVSGVDGVPLTTYGAPSQYGPPPHKYKAPVKPTGDGSSGGGALPNNNVQTSELSWRALGNYGNGLG